MVAWESAPCRAVRSVRCPRAPIHRRDERPRLRAALARAHVSDRGETHDALDERDREAGRREHVALDVDVGATERRGAREALVSCVGERGEEEGDGVVHGGSDAEGPPRQGAGGLECWLARHKAPLTVPPGRGRERSHDLSVRTRAPCVGGLRTASAGATVAGKDEIERRSADLHGVVGTFASENAMIVM
jgi:hypothetical protein